MLAPPGGLAPPPKGNPESATASDNLYRIYDPEGSPSRKRPRYHHTYLLNFLKLLLHCLSISAPSLPSLMAEWDRELSAVGGQEWSQACKHVHAIHDTKLRTFHLLFINQGYALNDCVSHFLNVGPQCRLCGQERETYVHLFWNCVFVQLIIDTVREVGINYLDQEEEWLTQKSFLLGTSPTLLPKTVALLGKRFIFLATIHSPTPTSPYTPLALFAI